VEDVPDDRPQLGLPLRGSVTGPQAADGGSLDSIRCSFCGRRGNEVESIVAGPTPGVAICSQCIGLVTEIMDEQNGPPPDSPPPPGDRAA
jgi:hypothetical protein